MTDLPRYVSPPVAEVLLSVQFEPIERLTPAHLGIWWQQGDRRDRYPLCEEGPPLDPVVEVFDPPGPPTFTLVIGERPPSPSVWFLAVDRSELLQVQRDRFTRNWTKGVGDRPYPSYDALRPLFQEEFDAFVQFLDSEGLSTPTITQVEITYVNALLAGAGWGRHGQVGAVLASWTGDHSDGFLGEPEDVHVVQRYVLRSSEGSPLGRLIVNLEPRYDARDSSPVLLLTLTGRGRPETGGTAGVLETLDVLHDHVVRGFSSLTTPSMHKEWGRSS